MKAFIQSISTHSLYNNSRYIYNKLFFLSYVYDKFSDLMHLILKHPADMSHRIPISNNLSIRSIFSFFLFVSWSVCSPSAFLNPTYVARERKTTKVSSMLLYWNNVNFSSFSTFIRFGGRRLKAWKGNWGFLKPFPVINVQCGLNAPWFLFVCLYVY